MKTDWNKIVEEAFESNETHVFSEKYCRRRSELQGGNTMEKNEYKNLVQKHTPKEDRLQNGVIAFLIGGCMGVLAQVLIDIYSYSFRI